jgi:hypothetical protein
MVHCIVITHTLRNLSGVFAGLSRQSEFPDTITLTCDSDAPELGDEARSWAPRFNGAAVRWVRRERCGKPRISQVRNNGVRALIEAGLVSRSDYLLFLDGDIVLEDDGIAKHRALAAQGFEMVTAHRAYIDRAPAETFDATAYAERRSELDVSGVDRERLNRMQRKSERHVRHRMFPWQAAHKPRLLGCHHATSFRAFEAVNGNDETIETVCWQDDDLARRLNRLRPRLKVAAVANRIVAFHLWHPAPEGSVRGPSSRERRHFTTVCAHGLTNPMPQPALQVSTF